MGGPRIERQLSQMLVQLERQLDLLEEYANRAFEEGDGTFLPEVAGKLRLLLLHAQHNTALLFEVAKRLGIVPTVVLWGPPVDPPPGETARPGDEITLDRFFNMHAVSVRTSEGLVSLTKRQLIKKWAEQLGGSHEDWKVEESLVAALEFPLLINDIHPSVIELGRCAQTTIIKGRELLRLAREAEE